MRVGYFLLFEYLTLSPLVKLEYDLCGTYPVKHMCKLPVGRPPHTIFNTGARFTFLIEVSVDALSFYVSRNNAKTIMLRACEKTCGRTTGRRGKERGWWWNDEFWSVNKELKMTNTLNSPHLILTTACTRPAII